MWTEPCTRRAKLTTGCTWKAFRHNLCSALQANYRTIDTADHSSSSVWVLWLGSERGESLTSRPLSRSRSRSLPGTSGPPGNSATGGASGSLWHCPHSALVMGSAPEHLCHTTGRKRQHTMQMNPMALSGKLLGKSIWWMRGQETQQKVNQLQVNIKSSGQCKKSNFFSIFNSRNTFVLLLFVN